jgi:hypothetical protein
VKSFTATVLALTCAPAFAQRHGGAPPAGIGGAGFPRGILGIGPRPLISPLGNPFSFGQRLADTVSGAWSWASFPPIRGGAGRGFGPGFGGFGGFGGVGGFGGFGGYPMPVPYPVYGGDPYQQAYYPQPSPPVVIVMPQQKNSSDWYGPTIVNDDYDASSGPAVESSGVHVYLPPAAESAPRQEASSPVVVLRNGWAYSVTKYWFAGRTFHFVTTVGEHRRVPTSLVSRLYRGAADKPAAAGK